MLGEGQILNQVKTAYRLATEAGTAGLFLNRLFQIALQSGKQVRSQTGLGFGGISVGSATAELLFRHMPQPSHERATVVLLGAGEMAEAAVMQFMAKKHSTARLRIASRSRSRAQALAERVGGENFAWDDLANVLADATAVIAATSAAQPVLRPGHFARRHPDVSSRPLLCLDLGLPRNIDPAVAQLSNLVLYDLDHINGVIDKNLQDRLAELPRAENILNGSLAEFDDWQHSLRVVPIIKNLRRISDEIRQGELERNRKNFKPEEWEHLDALTASLVNKLLHTPIKRLKELASDTHNHGRDLEAICEFFTTGENLVSKKTAPWHATE
jgi:glutamyl-tRNA reductase